MIEYIQHIHLQVTYYIRPLSDKRQVRILGTGQVITWQCQVNNTQDLTSCLTN